MSLGHGTFLVKFAQKCDFNCSIMSSHRGFGQTTHQTGSTHRGIFRVDAPRDDAFQEGKLTAAAAASAACKGAVKCLYPRLQAAPFDGLDWSPLNPPSDWWASLCSKLIVT